MTRREQPAGMNIAEAAEGKIADFAEDLGRLLGTARAKAEGWLAQRSQVTQTLQEIRDTASNLLTQLTGGSGVRKGRPNGARKGAGAGVWRAAPASSNNRAGRRKRRTMSAAARAKISAAQKRRWAAVRRMNGGKGRAS